jgi:hypothetical protein
MDISDKEILDVTNHSNTYNPDGTITNLYLLKKQLLADKYNFKGKELEFAMGVRFDTLDYMLKSPESKLILSYINSPLKDINGLIYSLDTHILMSLHHQISQMVHNERVVKGQQIIMHSLSKKGQRARSKKK